MSTMKELKASNTVQALIIDAIMQEYKNACAVCMNECVEKMMNGATMTELGPFIDAAQEKAKAKVIAVLKDSVVIVSKNLEEAKAFEVPDKEFITNTEYALEKAATLLQIV